MTDAIREALAEIASMTYDSWTNGARAGEIARAAIAAQPAQALPLDRDFILGLAAGELDCVDEEYIVRFARAVERALGIGSKP